MKVPNNAIESISGDVIQSGKTISDMLTKGQKAFMEAAKSGKNIFLTGHAGTGKSLVINLFIKESKKAGKNVMVLAPTGNASQLIEGSTIHHGLGIMPKDVIDTKKMTVKGKASKVLQAADVIIVDEVSMVRMDLFDFLAESIKKAENKRKNPIQMITVGDFCQLPPIIDRSRQEDKILNLVYGREVGSAFAFQSNNWDYFNFENHMLTEIMRQKDVFFIENLNKIRMGSVDGVCMSMLDGLYYGTFAEENAVYLGATRKDVDAENERRLSMIEGPDYYFKPYRTVWDAKSHMLEKMPEPLHLKVGARVMFTKNEHAMQWMGDKKPSFYNGTLGTVVDINRPVSGSRYASIKVVVDGTSEIVETGFVDFESYGYRYVDGKIETYICSSYKAVPLQLAYGVTIHKSQGITLPAVNINPYCFACGQFYVALSRCADGSRIHFTAPVSSRYIMADADVVNFYSGLDLTHARPASYSRNGTVTYPSGAKGGCPVRFPNGSKIMKVPSEIASAIKDFLDTVYPKKGSGTVKPARDALLAFLRNNTHNVSEKAKKHFSKGAGAVRIPAELADALNLFILCWWSGDDNADTLKAFKKEIKAIIRNYKSEEQPV